MRYLVIGFLFFTIGCSEHKKSGTDKISKIDTSKLFDPNPQIGKTVEPGTVLCNCLMLVEDKIVAGIKCEKIELQNDKELQDFLQKNAADIGKQKFYIVYSTNTTKNRIIDIIEIVKAKNINDYKVINLQSLITLNVPEQ